MSKYPQFERVGAGRLRKGEDLCVVGEECPADDCDGTVEYNWEER